jgi:A/G-specific adenine glycosylase
MMTPEIQAFQETVWAYYAAHGRVDLPWRQPAADGTFNAYHIMVSELMLQQTQVPRVIPKFNAFITQFPTVHVLAAAPLSAVLTAWSGLGYNRRAKFLWQAAQAIVSAHGGIVPHTQTALISLPGIGPNTAGAILTYAYNEPLVFIETNIRTVFIHHFFADEIEVHDTALRPLIEAALPRTEARDWYWALMDYGTHLKQTVGNRSRASATYSKQSAFEGSRRQIRGQILRLLTQGPHSMAMLVAANTDERLPAVVQELCSEGMIRLHEQRYTLAD